jgi:hypothetical protein
MRGAEHDVDGIGMRRKNRGERIDNVFDPLIRREQPEGQDDSLPVQAEASLASAVDRNVRNAMWNQIDLIGGNLMNPLSSSAPDSLITISRYDNRASSSRTIR